MSDISAVKIAIANRLNVSERVIRNEHKLKDDYFFSEKVIEEIVQEIEFNTGLQRKTQEFSSVSDVITAFLKASKYEDRVVRIICKQLGLKEEYVEKKSKFVDDLGADSLDQVELVMAFEEEFELEISDAEAEEIVTVEDALIFLEKKLK